MQTDSFVASGSSPTPDFELQNHGSIFLLIPQTISARIWIADHISREGREVNFRARQFRCSSLRPRVTPSDRSLSVSDIRSTEAAQTGRAGAVRAEPQLKVLSYYSIRTIPIQDDVRNSTGASRAPSFRRPTTVVSVSSRRTV